MIINVKYCGGCNPRYERLNIVENLKKRFPEMTICFGEAKEADAAVIICGCSAACADVNGCYGSYGRFVIWKETAQKDLYDFLENIHCEIVRSTLNTVCPVGIERNTK